MQVSLSHIQGYAEPCVMRAYAETWHILNPEIFTTLYNCISTHTQNPVKPYITLKIQNPGILIILEYSELWHI